MSEDPSLFLEGSLSEDERLAFTFKQNFPHLHIGDLLIGRVLIQLASIVQNLSQFLQTDQQFRTPILAALLAILVAFVFAITTSKIAVFTVAAVTLIALLPFYALMLSFNDKLTFALTNKRLICWNERSRQISWSLPLDTVKTIEVLDSNGSDSSVRFELADNKAFTVANVERAFDLKMMADGHR